jgi:hypothetical protein
MVQWAETGAPHAEEDVSMRQRGMAAGLFAVVLLAACGVESDVTVGPAESSAPTSADAPTSGLGDQFVDPQGTYTITTGSDWTEQTGTIVKEIEVWSVAPPSNGFAANVNVLTQRAPGMDLQQYKDFSARNMGDLTLIHQAMIQGTNGNPLGLFEYSGVMSGRPLHFLAVFDVLNDQAVVATFTTDEGSFADLRPEVEPFLRTLQAT